MNAIDVNLYNYLDDKWKSQYDSWSNNTAGYSSFADVMASTSEGQLYLDQLLSTGAISASMYSQPDSTQVTSVSGLTTDGASSAQASTSAATDTSTTTAASASDASSSTSETSSAWDDFYDFTHDDWQAANPDKMDMYNANPGLGIFMANNPEYGSIFVNGSTTDAQSVVMAYAQSYQAYNANQVQLHLEV